MNLVPALIQSVQHSGAPGAVAFVGARDETFLFEGVGYREKVSGYYAAQRATLYDLASLTKVVATTTAILLLRERGALDLDQPCSDFIPLSAFNGITLRHLLTHTSGLRAIGPWYKEVHDITGMIERIAEGGREVPPGVRRVYSDLGFMLLGRVVEVAGRDSLDAFCRQNIFQPLGMTRTMFCPPAEQRVWCAATENCPWRCRVMQGEVHDENAYALGGVAGHAGLFAPAEDLAIFCRALLAEKVLRRATLDEMLAFGQVPFYPWQAMGWRVDPWPTGAEGFLRARGAFGHSGWTGTSLWMDRGTGLFCILLSNTPHPDRSLRDNRTLRVTFHQAVCEQFFPASTNAHSGLDHLLWDNFDAVRDQRIAVLTHHAAVAEDGRPVLDLLKHCPDTRLVRIFTPEHGLTGQAEAGAAVGTQRGPAPVVSLYGKRQAPTAEELRDIDLLLVDLQDVGARYYTYPGTLKACLEACARAGKKVVVLDRPNPVGGTILEGPVARDHDALVCWGPVPARHGMTIGEIALFLRDNMSPSPMVEVIPLDAWEPKFLFDACALPWVPPSPNLPKPLSALLYTGACLFEGTNLNEGRGTETPFEIFGAPWLKPAAVLAALDPRVEHGCRLSPCSYTPRAIPGKSSDPRYRDTQCQGIRIEVDVPEAARPFSLVVALLRAILGVHPGELELTPYLDTLAGGTWVSEQVRGNDNIADALDALVPELAAFDARRPKLYTSGWL